MMGHLVRNGPFVVIVDTVSWQDNLGGTASPAGGLITQPRWLASTLRVHAVGTWS